MSGPAQEGRIEAHRVERDLVIRAQHGDEGAFSALSHAMGGRWLNLAQRILRDADSAEDATQQAIVAIWRQLPRLRDPDRFEGWAYRILVNACRTEMRRERRAIPNLSLLPADEMVGDAANQLADRDQLEQAFLRLPVEHRAILVLQHYLGLTLEQCAERLDIPVGTARSRSHYAKRELRAALEADERAFEREVESA
jgi:RNA polymerase sigma-70 factor (ECF subfamily)